MNKLNLDIKGANRAQRAEPTPAMTASGQRAGLQDIWYLFKRNRRLFLTYSASATDHNYCMGLLTVGEDADLLNPSSWKKSPVPVFRSSVTHSLYGPGHSCFTVSLSGADLLMYHARSYKGFKGNL